MFFVVSSAFLFILGQLDWLLSVPCAAVWIVPLLIGSKIKTLTFFQGFLWGVLVFVFHLSWIFFMFVHYDVGVIGFLVWLSTILWFALSSGIWFWSTRYSWFFSTIFFFMFLTRWSLIPYAKLEGYPLIHPMIPFIHLFKKKELGFDDGVIFVQPFWYKNKNPMAVGYAITDQICQCLRQCRNFHTIVMPESTFCFDIDEYQNFLPIWTDGCEDIAIILGTHRRSGDGYLNSVMIMQNGKITQCYDKQHFMLFVEQVPWGLNLFGQNIHKEAEFCNDVVFLGSKKYQIFVCSELFFESKKVKGLPILMLWNDSWLEFDWVKKIALRYIAYFAWKYNVDVLYASTMGMTNMKTLKNDL